MKLLLIVNFRLPIENQSAIGNRQLAISLVGMTRLELANQLIENQSAFHFAFIPMLVPAEGFEPTLSSF